MLARRWGIERSCGWLTHWGGLLRDRAGRLDAAAGRLACVAVLSGVEALLNPKPARYVPSRARSNRLLVAFAASNAPFLTHCVTIGL